MEKWKKIVKQKQKIIAPTWSDEFELLGGCCSVSDIQEFINYH